MSERLKELTSKYNVLSPVERVREIYKDYEPRKILVTTSFGTSSV